MGEGTGADALGEAPHPLGSSEERPVLFGACRQASCFGACSEPFSEDDDLRERLLLVERPDNGEVSQTPLIRGHLGSAR